MSDAIWREVVEVRVEPRSEDGARWYSVVMLVNGEFCSEHLRPESIGVGGAKRFARKLLSDWAEVKERHERGGEDE